MAFRSVIENATNLSRLATEQPVELPITTQLMKVTASSLITGSTYRYVYTVRTARVGNASSYTPAVEGSDDYTALSISELTNVANGPIGYGTDIDNLPTGFAPVAIPNGTYVLCVPHATDDGSFVWLIVNTQAIDGACT